MKTSTDFNQLPLLTGKFAVVRQSQNLTKMKFAQIHDDSLSAIDEAERLLAEDPTGKFLVIKVITTIGF